jgi:hypothetical protein
MNLANVFGDRHEELLGGQPSETAPAKVVQMKLEAESKDILFRTRNLAFTSDYTGLCTSATPQAGSVNQF